MLLLCSNHSLYFPVPNLLPVLFVSYTPEQSLLYLYPDQYISSHIFYPHRHQLMHHQQPKIYQLSQILILKHTTTMHYYHMCLITCFYFQSHLCSSSYILFFPYNGYTVLFKVSRIR